MIKIFSWWFSGGLGVGFSKILETPARSSRNHFTTMTEDFYLRTRVFSRVTWALLLELWATFYVEYKLLLFKIKSQALSLLCILGMYGGAAAAAKPLQSFPTLCNPIDGSPPGSAIPGILQARTLEWVVISFSRAWKWKVKVKSLSHVQLLATPWTAAYQTPPSMGLSRQGYWRGVPLPSPLGMYTHVLRILL